jgi:alpha-1,3/alpha-1,6-mannosyltransferase
MPQRPLQVAFIHPDLGIGAFLYFYSCINLKAFALGGAERLVVDAALGLQQLGHSVDIYTSYHDRAHCFEETRDGVYPPLSSS